MASAQILIERLLDDEESIDDCLPTPNVNDLYKDHTPLNFAIYCRREKAVELLMNQPNIDLNRKNGAMPEGVFIRDDDYNEWDVVDEKLAFLTAAELARDRCPTFFIHLRNIPQVDERQAEIERRADIQDIESEERKRVMALVTGQDVDTIRQMMNQGTIPANIWANICANSSEEQLKAPALNQQKDNSARLASVQVKISELQRRQIELERLSDITTELTTCKNQIATLRREQTKLEKQRQKIQRKLELVNMVELELRTIEMLAKAETIGYDLLTAHLREKREESLLELEDVGFFLNVLGMARLAQKIYETGYQPSPLRNLALFAQAPSMETYLGDYLDIEFGIDMVKRKQFPPYDKHQRECPMCSNSPSDLVKEYGIQLDEECLVQQNITSSGLLFLSNHTQVQSLTINDVAECVNTLETIRALRESHINNIISSGKAPLAENSTNSATQNDVSWIVPPPAKRKREN